MKPLPHKHRHFSLVIAAILLSSLPIACHETGDQNDALPKAGFYNNAENQPINTILDGATKSLDIEIYQMTDPDVVTSIRKAIDRKVRVRVVKEPTPVGDTCNVFADPTEGEDKVCTDQRSLKADILSHGGAYVPFNKEQLCATKSKPCFEHGKMIIADKKAVLISTGNFNSSNLCNLTENPEKCNREYSFVSRDPGVVTTLEEVFSKDLKGVAYDLQTLIRKQPVVTKITVSPFSLEPWLRFIKMAHKSIRVENQYLKEPTVNQALIDAAKNKIKVSITLASACAFGKPSPKETVRLQGIFTPMEQAGISIRMLTPEFKINGKPGYLHSKAIVIDDSMAWVGSVNGSYSALSNNREFGMFFSEPEWVTPLLKVMIADHDAEEMETWQESIECKKDFSGPSLPGED
jgi:phosphatidylserine/phosphatidylglycerophosphate/cardiolipin synthase-like enzyme